MRMYCFFIGLLTRTRAHKRSSNPFVSQTVKRETLTLDVIVGLFLVIVFGSLVKVGNVKIFGDANRQKRKLPRCKFNECANSMDRGNVKG